MFSNVSSERYPSREKPWDLAPFQCAIMANNSGRGKLSSAPNPYSAVPREP